MNTHDLNILIKTSFRPMELNIKECESVIGLIKLKNISAREKCRFREYQLNTRKINILERLHSFATNPTRSTIENISHLINLPEKYVLEWFTRKNKNTNINVKKDFISLKVILNIFLYN